MQVKLVRNLFVHCALSCHVDEGEVMMMMLFVMMMMLFVIMMMLFVIMMMLFVIMMKK